MDTSRKALMMPSTHPEALFVDIWGWLALADSRDPAHGQAISERRSRSGPGSLITSDYILDETFTRLFSRVAFSAARKFSGAILAAVENGLLRLERVTPARFDEAYRMRLQYRDKPLISFTDLTSFVVMRELGVRDVLTADVHFAQVQLGFRRVPSGVTA
jgi:predicted nucleic acid-binding protein